jgi:hypothetical protein
MARRKRIKAEHFLSVKIRLPPRDEQKRIAALTGLTLGVEKALDRNRGVIAALGQSVLDGAFENEA